MSEKPGIRLGAAAALALLFGMNLLDYIDRNILAAVLPRIQTEMHLSDTQAGWLAPAFLVAYTVFAPIMGWAGDRYTRTRLLVLGVGLWSLATVGSGFADTYGHLVLARSLLGIGEATYGTLAPTILADLYPRSSRGKVLSFFYLAIPVGSALGYVFGGLIEPVYGWRAAFWLVGGPGLLAALSGLLLDEPARGAMDHEDGAVSHSLAHVSVRDYRHLIHNRSYVHNTLGMALMTFALGGLAFWMPTYFHRVKGLTLQEANVWIGPLTVAAGFLGTITGGWLADRLLRRTAGAYFLVSGSGMFFAAPFALIALLAESPAVYLPATFIAECCLFLNTGPCNAILVNVVNPAMRSSAFAINIFLIHVLGDIWSPNAIGAVSDATGNLTAGMLITVLAMVGSSLLLLTGIRHLERDQQATLARP
ncbi:MAG: MFS transporter [Candidatus Latescibacteria bacterium]|nr:MFS transporter [Candidatus Latescibacterota bacterium]